MSDPFDDADGGPAADTRDRVEVERDWQGRYLIPDLPEDYEEQFARQGFATPTGPPRAWTRTTTLAKTLADTFTLNAWGLRMAVKGLAMSPDLIALAAATPVEDRKTLDGVAEQSKDRAAARARANIGTALHSFTEQVDKGEEPFIPAPWDADVAAYSACLRQHGLVPEPDLIEGTIINPRFGTAGMFDRIISGRVFDLKTGRRLDYAWGEIAIQLVIYATAPARWDWERRVFLPMPEGLSLTEGLVLHLPAGEARATLYKVDLTAAAEAADLCVQVRTWRGRKGIAAEVRPEGDEDLFSALASPAPVVEPVADPWTEPSAAQVCPLCGQVHDGGCRTRADDAPSPVAGLTPFEEDAPAPAAVDGLGDPLQPFAEAGKRGCSKCRRTGHRANSPRCLGDRDPGGPGTVAPVEPPEAAPSPAPEPPEAADGPPDVCPRTGECSRAGWAAENGPQGATGRWVCAHCGKVGVPPDDTTPEAAPEPPEAAGQPFSVAEELEATPEPPVAPQAASQPVEDEVLDDPFADDALPAPPTWAQRIAAARTVQELADIGGKAKAAGELTLELIRAGKARRAELLPNG